MRVIIQSAGIALLCVFLSTCLPQASAIPNYKECFDCFYANRTSNYYCQSNRQCLPVKSTKCAASQILYKEYQCAEGFQPCVNVTFTKNSIGLSFQLGYGLSPGNGCYIQIDRLRNGTVGTMSLLYDDPNSILVFDAQQRNYQPGLMLGMPVSDYGWAPRKIFVVNRGDQPAAFQVQFVGGVLTQVSLAIIAAILSASFVLMSL